MKKARCEVVIVKADPLERSPRVVREFNLLKKAGYIVKVLCWNREQETIRIYKESEDFKVKQDTLELKFKAPFGVKSIPYLLVWWCYVLRTLIKFNQWQIAHVINFPSLFPVLLLCKITRKPLVYEILDYAYADQIVMPAVFRSIFLAIEKLFARFPDSIIIVDELQIEEFGGIPNSNIVLIYDSPRDVYRRSGKVSIPARDDRVFTLFYAGVLYKNRKLNLDKIVEAVKGLEGVRVVIAGYGDMVEEIREWCRTAPDSLQYIGRLSHRQVLEESMKADLLFVVRDPIVPVNRYVCGSKFLESVMLGKPLLANKEASTSIKVDKENCGVVIDATNVMEIRETILTLKNDKQLCEKLGVNARKAYEQRYSWNMMASRLLSLYDYTLHSSAY